MKRLDDTQTRVILHPSALVCPSQCPSAAERRRNEQGGTAMVRTRNSLPMQHLRALVFDDDARVVHDLRRSLEARSFSVASAGDGTGGLALLIDELLGLDVLVMDMDLPGRDARSLANLIRRAGGERDLAIVVLATAPCAALRGELLALGVDAVLDRSCGPEAAAQAVEDVVANRRRSNAQGSETARAAVAGAPSARDPRWTLSIPWSPLAA
jgi:CheY-like chemotaxis protein